MDKENKQNKDSTLKNNDDGGSDSEEGASGFSIEALKNYLIDKLVIGSGNEVNTSKKVIDNLSIDGLTKNWQENGFKNIITMVGAGISTSAGIPDFRSPGSGLYDNLQKYNLPTPQAIFDLDYFDQNPKPFFALAKELYPGTFKPTPAHYFVRILNDKGLLLRHYTQNIDTLDRIAGIPEEKLVEAHGTFYTNHCLNPLCRKFYSMEWMKAKIMSEELPLCDCKSVVKPDIVFFGENLPDKFHSLPSKDFQKCDLLIIMGTSLEVQPFASLVDYANSNCIRLLINRDKVGRKSKFNLFSLGPGMLYDSEDNTRDIAFIGDCDDGVNLLVEKLGWKNEFDALIASEYKKLKEESEINSKDKE